MPCAPERRKRRRKENMAPTPGPVPVFNAGPMISRDSIRAVIPWLRDQPPEAGTQSRLSLQDEPNVSKSRPRLSDDKPSEVVQELPHAASEESADHRIHRNSLVVESDVEEVIQRDVEASLDLTGLEQPSPTYSECASDSEEDQQSSVYLDMDANARITEEDTVSERSRPEPPAQENNEQSASGDTVIDVEDAIDSEHHTISVEDDNQTRETGSPHTPDSVSVDVTDDNDGELPDLNDGITQNNLPLNEISDDDRGKAVEAATACSPVVETDADVSVTVMIPEKSPVEQLNEADVSTEPASPVSIAVPVLQSSDKVADPGDTAAENPYGLSHSDSLSTVSEQESDYSSEDAKDENIPAWEGNDTTSSSGSGSANPPSASGKKGRIAIDSIAVSQPNTEHQSVTLAIPEYELESDAPEDEEDIIVPAVDAPVQAETHALTLDVQADVNAVFLDDVSGSDSEVPVSPSKRERPPWLEELVDVLVNIAPPPELDEESDDNSTDLPRISEGEENPVSTASEAETEGFVVIVRPEKDLYAAPPTDIDSTDGKNTSGVESESQLDSDDASFSGSKLEFSKSPPTESHIHFADPSPSTSRIESEKPTGKVVLDSPTASVVGLDMELNGAPPEFKSQVSFKDGQRPEKLDADDLPEVIVNPDAQDKHVGGRKVRLSWHDLCVTADLPGPSIFSRIRNSCCTSAENRKDYGVSPKKQILFDVNADANPGSLLAIMGASGAGKTTLLNVLARQSSGGLKVEGQILVNGRDIGSEIRSISAYVRQEDLFFGTLKVKEHLHFQALLRMDSKYTKQQKLDRVQEVMHELSLNKCKDTVIGIPGRIKGISGGEMKRLSLASEILNHPSLLFADEPTSGLDSFMAESVCSALRNIASQGKTVVATIHQPASDTFHLFDRLLLMSEGRVAYLGPVDKAVDFFQKAGYPCPSNFNPADHYIHTLAIIPGKEDESKAKAKGICDFYEQELLGRKPSDPSVRRQSSVITMDLDRPQKYQSSWLAQLATITHRASIATYREPFMVKSRFSECMMLALISGLVFLRQDYDQIGVENLNGALFFTIIMMSFNTVMGSIFTFPVEIPVFQKEHKLRMYRTDTYYLGKNIAEAPWSILFPSLFCVIAYWMIGFRDDAAAFFIYTAYILLVVQASVSFGYFIACISPSVQVANGIAPAMIMPFLLFGGFFLRDESVPDYFIWLKWISWFKYSYELILVNQWEGYTGITCGSANATCLRTGNEVIADRGYDDGNVGRNIGLMVALIVAWRILAFLVLLGRASRK